MSSPPLSPSIIQGIVTQLEDGRIAISAGCAAAALVIFDFFLTSSKEVQHIWMRKKSLVFVLFSVLRYATIFYQITFNLAFFLPIRTNKGCAAMIYVEQVAFILSSTALSGVFTLRTFAIYQRNWYILALLSVVASVKIFMSAVDFFVNAKVATVSTGFSSFASCSSSFAPNQVKWNTAASGLALLFDTLVMGLTVYKTVSSVIATRRMGVQRSYSYYVFRDGLLYYLAIELLLLFDVIFNQIPALAIKVARVMIILQTSLAPILGQRLLLNLRVVDPDEGSSTEKQSDPGQLQFAHGPIIGNIGAALETSFDSTEDLSNDGTLEANRSESSGTRNSAEVPVEMDVLRSKGVNC